MSADWRDFANCQGTANADLWFADDQPSVDAAKRVCQGCEVRQACLDFAITNREQHGVWGGEDLGGREREKKARRRAELERKQRVA